jgi:hypothetical protein
MVLEPTADGLACRNATVADRDGDGVLWALTTSSPGLGEPLYSAVHSIRQRRAMRNLLCQVCGEPASPHTAPDRDDEEVLWLIGADGERWHDWPEGCLTAQPPVHSSCARDGR